MAITLEVGVNTYVTLEEANSILEAVLIIRNGNKRGMVKLK